MELKIEVFPNDFALMPQSNINIYRIKVFMFYALLFKIIL